MISTGGTRNTDDKSGSCERCWTDSALIAANDADVGAPRRRKPKPKTSARSDDVEAMTSAPTRRNRTAEPACGPDAIGGPRRRARAIRGATSPTGWSQRFRRRRTALEQAGSRSALGQSEEAERFFHAFIRRFPADPRSPAPPSRADRSRRRAVPSSSRISRRVLRRVPSLAGGARGHVAVLDGFRGAAVLYRRALCWAIWSSATRSPLRRRTLNGRSNNQEAAEERLHQLSAGRLKGSAATTWGEAYVVRSSASRSSGGLASGGSLGVAVGRGTAGDLQDPERSAR